MAAGILLLVCITAGIGVWSIVVFIIQNHNGKKTDNLHHAFYISYRLIHNLRDYLNLKNVICAIIREFMEPKLIGERMGIFPVVILFSVYAGVQLFGPERKFRLFFQYTVFIPRNIRIHLIFFISLPFSHQATDA